MSDDLRDFFSEISKSKKEKKKKLEEAKEELNSIVGDLGLDSLFQEFGKIKKEEVKKKKKQEKKLEAFENFFANIDEKKEEEPVIEVEEVIEKPEEVIDEIIEKEEIVEPIVAEEEIVEEEPIVAEEEVEDEEFEEEVEEVLEDASLIEKSLGMLASTDKNEDPLTPLDKKFATMEEFQKHYVLLIQRIQQQLSTLGGGGIGSVEDDTSPKLGGDLDVNGKYITGTGNLRLTGIVSATTFRGETGDQSAYFVGDGSGLINIVSTAEGGIGIKEDGIVIGTATTVDFGHNLNVTPAHAGFVTITACAGIDTTSTSTFKDVRVVGILTIGSASITLDPTEKTIVGLDRV